MAEQMTTGAREAIRIAEETFPANITRQAALAKKIINAINLCESELAEEIIQRGNGGPRDRVGSSRDPS